MGVESLIQAIKKVEPPSFSGNTYTWSFDDFGFEYRMNCYCIQKALKSLDKNFFIYQEEVSADFEYDVDLNETIVIEGIIIFHDKKKNYTLEFDHKVSTITLSSNDDISKVKIYFEDYIKFNNPLKRKNLQIYEKSGDMSIAYHPVTPLKWSTLIIDPEIKEKIWNNTIFQMDNMDLNNGIILHGPAGLGKSSIAKSLIYEAAEKGYSSCYITSSVSFTSFGLFLRKYLSPCIVIFEDIDSFAGSREDKENSELSDFLQLISGLSDDKNKIIFIATTNYLKFIDEAVKSRPMRFNRNFLIDYPKPPEIDQLIDMYFENSIDNEKKKLCYYIKFGGAHIKEIKRTCEMLSLINKKSFNENFVEAVEEVKTSFNKTGNIMGFGSTLNK